MVEGHVPARGWGVKSPFAHWRVGAGQALITSCCIGKGSRVGSCPVLFQHSTSDVPKGEFVAEAGDEGAFTGGQAGCW